MPDFQPGQTIKNYIYHNQEFIKKSILSSYTYAQLAKLLTESNTCFDKMSGTKLLHIVHYLLVKPEIVNTTNYLPEPGENETIIEYIRSNARAIIVHKRLNNYGVTAQTLTGISKCGDKISSQKLGNICQYIEEELRNGTN